MIEKQVHFRIADMIRGKPAVPLGDIAEIRRGTRASKERDEGTMYPAYGGGDLMSYKVDAFNRDGLNYKVSCKGVSPHNCVMKIHGKCFLIESALTVHSSDQTRALDGFIGEWLLMHKDEVYELGRGTAQKNLDVDGLKCMQIPLPSIQEQQTLVSDFEEIAHKRGKAAEYEAKARAALAPLAALDAPAAPMASDDCASDQSTVECPTP
jgi:restriction endonuclease S subunit